MAPLSCGRPSLDVFEDLGTNVLVDGSWTDGFQQGDEVVHELSRGNLGKEVLAPILDAGICELHGKLAMRMMCVLGRWERLVRRTFNALSWVFGFLSPMRFFKERMASLGGTVLDLTTSDISRLRAISSLQHIPSIALAAAHSYRDGPGASCLQTAACSLLYLLVQGG